MIEFRGKDEMQWDGKNTVAGWNTLGMMCGIKGGGWNTVGEYNEIYGKPCGGRVKSRECMGGIHWDV
jgi:hypothetical protein